MFSIPCVVALASGVCTLMWVSEPATHCNPCCCFGQLQVFGAFGMNLNSHVWETPGAFKKTVWITCMGIFLMTLATFGALQVYLRS